LLWSDTSVGSATWISEAVASRALFLCPTYIGQHGKTFALTNTLVNAILATREFQFYREIGLGGAD